MKKSIAENLQFHHPSAESTTLDTTIIEMQLRILNNNVHVHITLHTTRRAWFMCMESSEVP
jgi:hypothetical protein